MFSVVTVRCLLLALIMPVLLFYLMMQAVVRYHESRSTDEHQ